MIPEKRLPVPGTTIGQYTMTEVVVEDGRQYVLMECACGTKRKILLANWIQNQPKSCGCQQKNPPQKERLRELRELEEEQYRIRTHRAQEVIRNKRLPL